MSINRIDKHISLYPLVYLLLSVYQYKILYYSIPIQNIIQISDVFLLFSFFDKLFKFLSTIDFE